MAKVTFTIEDGVDSDGVNTVHCSMISDPPFSPVGRPTNSQSCGIIAYKYIQALLSKEEHEAKVKEFQNVVG